ncbi:DUF86 domain-containing protein [bacterium]|nr:DUF86 domain-containing protein [bacterium]
MKGDRALLEHILDCITHIEDWVAGGVESLDQRQTRDAVLRNLQVLAESSIRLSDELRARHPEVDWRAMHGFRNVLVHDYLGIELELVRKVLHVSLPELKRVVTDELARLRE